MMPSRGYLVCCIERTGSNLLCHALDGTGLAGRPTEYFNPMQQDKGWIRNILGDLTLAEGLSKILEAGSTPNGVFGAKVHCNHFYFLGRKLQGVTGQQPAQLLHAQLLELHSETEIHDLLRARFWDLGFQNVAWQALHSLLPDLRIIWLRRRNMVARAISHFRARETGQWFRSASAESSAQVQTTLDFDFAKIRALCCLGSFEEALWQRFFDEHHISPHPLFYEDLTGSYEPTVREVLDFLDLQAGDIAVVPPNSLKQSDAISEEWESRYLSLRAKGGSD
jgi:LPS sulfotransferase NodH